MKTNLRLVMVGIISLSVFISLSAKQPVYTEKEKVAMKKEIEKEAKKVAKDNIKQGWQIEQSGLMENIIAKHLYQVRVEGLRELNGSSVGKKTISMCRKQIQIDVPNAYAKEQSQVIKGVVTNKDRNKDGDEAEDFIGEYETRLAMEVAGELQESYSLYRKNNDGTYDMRIFYLVNPEAAHSAKIRAAKRSMEIQKLDEEWRKSISDAINESAK